MKELNFGNSFAIFAGFSLLLLVETYYLIPFFSGITGTEPILWWFIVGGAGVFLPLLICAYFILKGEGEKLSLRLWKERLRFRPLSKRDIYYSLSGIFAIGVLSFGIVKVIELFAGHSDLNPSFMTMEPLTSGRYWLLLVWFPYWLLNIMGEEILWRGVMFPRQELKFGSRTWMVHGFLWGIFHIAFGWKLLLTLLPILLIQSYVVQKTSNSWTGVIIHAVINGPSFILIALGIIN